MLFFVPLHPALAGWTLILDYAIVHFLERKPKYLTEDNSIPVLSPYLWSPWCAPGREGPCSCTCRRGNTPTS